MVNNIRFSKEELKDAARTIFNAQHESTFESVKEVYDNLRYLLGSHYWSYEYAWEGGII